MTEPLLFALQDAHEFGERVAAASGIALSPHEAREFEDGEHKSRPLVAVRSRDVYVIQCLHGGPERSVNDKLVGLLLFIGGLKESGAASVTALVPYLCYARKDQKTNPRDPVVTKYVAQLFEAVGLDRMVTLDVHNLAAFQNAFRCQTDHLEAAGLFAAYFRDMPRPAPIVLVSPDAGGVKRVNRFRKILGRYADEAVETAFMEKSRSGGVVQGKTLVGDVAGKTAIILDDLVSTGATMARAVRACRRSGAATIHAVATHGLFVDGAEPLLSAEGLDRLIVTNSVPPFRLSRTVIDKRLVLLDVTPMFGEAIHRIHSGGSIVELLEPSTWSTCVAK